MPTDIRRIRKTYPFLTVKAALKENILRHTLFLAIDPAPK
jgi:hypothetical protein